MINFSYRQEIFYQKLAEKNPLFQLSHLALSLGQEIVQSVKLVVAHAVIVAFLDILVDPVLLDQMENLVHLELLEDLVHLDGHQLSVKK